MPRFEGALATLLTVLLIASPAAAFCRSTTCKGGDCGCGASQPRCGSGQSCCSDTCVDLDDDEAHCGSCTTNCGLGTCCSRSCADTLGDNANCGGCDMPCGTSEMCVAGICTLIVLPGPGGSE